jgi:hypothetical protein
MLRAPRAARAAANDRLQGGLGAVPRRESGPLDFRVRQAAFDVMTRVRGSVADRELHLDWALGAMNVPAILKAITDFEGTPAGECAAARARVAAPQMGGHERRAAVAARARSRPEASPRAPRAITAASVLAAVGGEHDIDAERRGGGNGDGRPPSVFHWRFLAPSPRKNPTLVVPYRTCVRHDDTTEATTTTPRDNRNQDRDHNRHD